MSRPLSACALLLGVLVMAGCSLEDAPLIGKPAATMDGHTISMSDYRQRLKVEEDLYKGTKSESEKQDIAIRSLVDETLIADEAARKNLTVSDDDVNKEVDFQHSNYDQLVAVQKATHPSQSPPPDFNQFLRNEGYDVDSLRTSVRYILLEQKLEHKMAANRADEAYRALTSGTSFADVAKQYSDLASAKTGGEETITDQQQAGGDPKLQGPLNALQPGDSSKVVEGVNGFYIFKLVRRTDADITVDIVFVSAPAPNLYTPKLRPQWFSTFVRSLEDAAHVKYNVGPRAT